MYYNDHSSKDSTIKRLEEEIDNLKRENQSLKNDIKDLDDELENLSIKFARLSEDLTILENEYHESEVTWENTLEQLEEDLAITYETYLADFIKINPSLGLTSKYEKVRTLAETLIKQSSG